MTRITFSVGSLGSVHLDGGTVRSPYIEIVGDLEVDGGTFQGSTVLQAESEARIVGDGRFESLESGDFFLNLASVEIKGTATFDLFAEVGERFLGDGTVVFHQGVVFENLRMAREVEGNVAFTSENWLALGIGWNEKGDAEDVLDIGGEAILGGLVEVQLAPEIERVDGLRVELLRAGKIVGNFDSYELPTLGDGLRWVVERGPHSLAIVVAVPEVSPLAFMIVALSVAFSCHGWISRRRRWHAMFGMKGMKHA
ncbi:MAG: hypothetical protein U1D30_25550 [Planctomycetota bacterium]